MKRTVVRNLRFQLIGLLFSLFAAGMVVLVVVVLTSPGQSIDNPDGFTGTGRVLAAGGCLVAAAALGAFGFGALRVALIIDDTRLVIRNPTRTVRIDWTSHPKFEARNRRQDVSIDSPVTGSPSSGGGQITYRYREIVCTVQRKDVYIAATSRMSRRARVDDLLTELRQAAGRSQSSRISKVDSSG